MRGSDAMEREGRLMQPFPREQDGIEMDKLEIMKARHSVRNFTGRRIEGEVAERLQAEVTSVNAEGGLNIQLFLNEPGAFKGNEPKYGQFSGCCNYLACVGPKDAEEAIGYYGERLVLLAQELGLNTCWVGLTYKKGAVKVDADAGEKLHIVIAVGYGETQGVARREGDAHLRPGRRHAGRRDRQHHHRGERGRHG